MNNLTVSFMPHITGKASTSRMMRDVIIALLPAALFSVVLFGLRAMIVIFVCMAFSVLFEWLFQLATKRPVTVGDWSAALTGLLLALSLPATIPLWQAVFGCLVAVILVKQLFGGLGKNFANPAVTAHIVMSLAFETPMAAFVSPSGGRGIHPLTHLFLGEFDALPGLPQMFFGMHTGSIGETSAFLLIIGGIYLLWRKVITWHAPAAFVGTVVVITALLGAQPVYHLLSGALLLAAIFMATDGVTTPLTKSGRVIFGIGAGLFTVTIRMWGNSTEGVFYAILLMNILVPFINAATCKKALGGIKA